MKKFKTKILITVRHSKSGSALLIAILVMGILMTLTLGLMDLVIREIRQTGDLIAAGQAYFSAEAGVENGLMDLYQNLPGYETKNPLDPNDLYITLQDFPAGLQARYRILNKASSVPFFDPDKPIFLGSGNVPTNINFVYSAAPEATYNDLPLSESVVIPLYSAADDGSLQNVTKFLIEYYVSYDSAELGQSLIAPQDFLKLDILRWKVFGKPGVGGDVSKTDAISDFFPADYNSSAATPMCIGTYPGLDTGGCIFPALDAKAGAPVGATLWGAARECYTSDSGSTGGALADIQNTCTIENFINNHNQNYLVLTNVINPDILLPGQNLNTAEAKAKFKIHYRVVAEPGFNPVKTDTNPKLVREVASISADGFASNGRVKQSIDVKINQSSFLPVFNFSLYHTDTN